ncbi:hydroxymethylpyrimidine/phosphomethylpyrimidine kinase [Gillisia sp. Hel_I_86]|uniref:hydroxymethylpyrimidine/phosphomethylpyrimidine kinase n=1 Tax=Gillisia sp. Hel_I_86 TaxID=1249981 RepID=UPI001199E0E0|nr:hydroxymethylpyrimidine/phosphomethylpyrimidine kinase [Gillisia sp. Hel_I_86]TVZ26353.1 hydroxymethylpyrimidine/phosphomethylpyrimidine kinase [Gillisia sp. Hel_I_86]
MYTTKRPFVLSIAGFDPSAGAGFLADVKTLETLGCYGLAINTANTIQHDVTFQACHWIPKDLIFQQLEMLLDRFSVKVVKIGIIENLSILNKVIDKLLNRNKNIRVIWDPVLKSTSGYAFQGPQEFQEHLDEVLEKVFLVTPNFEEIKMFYPGFDLEEKIGAIRMKTNLYLKGRHRTEAPGLDELFTTGGNYFSLAPGRNDCTEKHGSGCIVSSALAAYLVFGFSLPEAAEKAKSYTERVLASNTTLLGYHHL